MNKIAKKSTDYIEEIASKDALSREQKIAAFNTAKIAGNFSKIGQGFIGPVMFRLKYEGIARNILTEDIIAPGAVPVYDVADEMGKAYRLEPYQTEAVISQFEGKRVTYGFKRIAAFPVVQEIDALMLTIDMIEYAMGEAKQRIQEQEDGYLFAMLNIAIDSITDADPDFAGLGTDSHEIAVTGGFQPESFYAAAKVGTLNRLDTKHIVINPVDRFDMMEWDLMTSAVAWRNEAFETANVGTFAGFDVFTSILLPVGNGFVLPDSDYLGRFPTLQSINIEEDNQVERFSKGWVMSELCNLIILNRNGIVRLQKN